MGAISNYYTAIRDIPRRVSRSRHKIGAPFLSFCLFFFIPEEFIIAEASLFFGHRGGGRFDLERLARSTRPKLDLIRDVKEMYKEYRRASSGGGRDRSGGKGYVKYGGGWHVGIEEPR